MTNENRTHVDLFSGLGCWSIAAHANGISTIALCEREEWLARGLEKIWGCPCHRDVKTFPAEQYRGAWLLTGSPPCQPASLAGKRRGASDDRWLWRETIAICEVIHPAWFCLENPPGIDGVGLDGIILDLERIGYEVQPIRIPACAVNSPQDRDRFWIMGHSTESRQAFPDKSRSEGRTKAKDGCGMRESQRATQSGTLADAGCQPTPAANEQFRRPQGSHSIDGEPFESGVVEHTPGEPHSGARMLPEAERWDATTPRPVESGVVAYIQWDSQRTRLCEAESRGIGRGRSSDPTWQDYEWIEFNGEFYRAPVGLYELADECAAVIPRKFRSKLIGALGNAIVWPIAYQIIRAMIQAESQAEP